MSLPVHLDLEKGELTIASHRVPAAPRERKARYALGVMPAHCFAL